MKESQFPHINFGVNREYLDENGIWNPKDEDPPLEDAFQVNVFGTKKEYLKLSEFFRELAEKDTSLDGDYHEHYEEIMSIWGGVRLHVILRKDDVGDSIYSDYFPRDDS